MTFQELFDSLNELKSTHPQIMDYVVICADSNGDIFEPSIEPNIYAEDEGPDLPKLKYVDVLPDDYPILVD